MLRWRVCAFQPEKQRAAVAVLSFYVNKGLKAVFFACNRFLSRK